DDPPPPQISTLSLHDALPIFSAVLAAFMAGLALGSLLGGSLADRGSRLARYAYLELAVALCGWLSKPAIAAAQRAILSMNLVERSEEHTSELQSRGHLVCRLL